MNGVLAEVQSARRSQIDIDGHVIARTTRFDVLDTRRRIDDSGLSERPRHIGTKRGARRLIVAASDRGNILAHDGRREFRKFRIAIVACCGSLEFRGCGCGCDRARHTRGSCHNDGGGRARGRFRRDGHTRRRVGGRSTYGRRCRRCGRRRRLRLRRRVGRACVRRRGRDYRWRRRCRRGMRRRISWLRRALLRRRGRCGRLGWSGCDGRFGSDGRWRRVHDDRLRGSALSDERQSRPDHETEHDDGDENRYER